MTELTEYHLWMMRFTLAAAQLKGECEKCLEYYNKYHNNFTEKQVNDINNLKDTLVELFLI